MATPEDKQSASLEQTKRSSCTNRQEDFDSLMDGDDETRETHSTSKLQLISEQRPQILQSTTADPTSKHDSGFKEQSPTMQYTLRPRRGQNKSVQHARASSGSTQQSPIDAEAETRNSSLNQLGVTPTKGVYREDSESYLKGSSPVSSGFSSPKHHLTIDGASSPVDTQLTSRKVSSNNQREGLRSLARSGFTTSGSPDQTRENGYITTFNRLVDEMVIAKRKTKSQTNAPRQQVSIVHNAITCIVLNNADALTTQENKDAFQLTEYGCNSWLHEALLPLLDARSLSDPFEKWVLGLDDKSVSRNDAESQVVYWFTSICRKCLEDSKIHMVRTNDIGILSRINLLDKVLNIAHAGLRLGNRKRQSTLLYPEVHDDLAVPPRGPTPGRRYEIVDDFGCICNRNKEGATMIQCNACGKWHHTACHSLPKKVVGRWFCPRC